MSFDMYCECDECKSVLTEADKTICIHCFDVY